MTKYIPNPTATAQIEVSPEMQAALMVAAERGAENARAIAPVETGALRDSIHAESAPGRAFVIADVPYAVFVEFGTSDTPMFAMLRRGTDGKLV